MQGLPVRMGWWGRERGQEGVQLSMASNPEPSPHGLKAFPTTLRFESISFPPRFSSFSSPASIDSTPALSPSHQGHHSAGFDKCHLFLKVALEKGNLTAVRQNRDVNASRPLLTRAQPQEQNEASVVLPGLLVIPSRLSPGICALYTQQRPSPVVGALPPSFHLHSPLSSATCFLAGN